MLIQTQIKNLNKLDKDTLLQLMHECAEILGVVSIKEYCEATNIPRRTVYDYIDRNKIKYLRISEHKFPVIND